MIPTYAHCCSSSQIWEFTWLLLAAKYFAGMHYGFGLRLISPISDIILGYKFFYILRNAQQWCLLKLIVAPLSKFENLHNCFWPLSLHGHALRLRSQANISHLRHNFWLKILRNAQQWCILMLIPAPLSKFENSMIYFWPLTRPLSICRHTLRLRSQANISYLRHHSWLKIFLHT